MQKMFKKNRMTNWIFSHFPENYIEMDYIEPFSSSLFFIKNPSNMEIINEPDVGLVQILRALKDVPDDFINKLKVTTCSENVFKRELKRTIDNLPMDFFDQAISEYIVRNMSKNCNKKKF